MDFVIKHQTCLLQGMNEEILADIMARVDGSALASVACTCTGLRDFAHDQTMWKIACHSKWPSTALEEAKNLVSASVNGRFDRFFADAYPLIFYDESVANDNTSELPECPKLKFHASPSDFLSLVDVYYKNECVLSRVFDGIPQAADICEHSFMNSSWDTTATERQKWFLNSPFKLELLDVKVGGEDEASPAPLLSLVYEAGKWVEENCKNLPEDLRLSWILVDKKAGKAVNLSSWKPFSVQRSWPHHGTYVARFGCVIPVEESVVPHKLARCTIIARLKMTERGERPEWREISMSIETITGSHVSGRGSLMILKKALYSRRSTNWTKVENGLRCYEKQKKEMIRRRDSMETLANTVYAFIEITLFVLFYLACTRLI